VLQRACELFAGS